MKRTTIIEIAAMPTRVARYTYLTNLTINGMPKMQLNTAYAEDFIHLLHFGN